MEPERALALRNAYRGGLVAPGEHPHVLVAAMPKSGSSLLVRLIAELPDVRPVALVRGHDRRENELALELLVAHHDEDWVARAPPPRRGWGPAAPRPPLDDDGPDDPDLRPPAGGPDPRSRRHLHEPARPPP